MATVSLKHVKKIYDNKVTAVHSFDLEIADKEFIVLVGPSGCGKSTTLRMVAGLEDISEGELFIGGKLMNHVPPKDRDIAMVFQSYALYPHMTVYENMAFALKLRKMPRADIDLRVRQAAEILDVTRYLERKPRALSGGQRQRVAIGRAIVRHPQVFLMDEPLSNLDAKLRGQMRSELMKLRSRIDTTFLYVTHDQTEAMTLGDRIVVMRDGLIQQVGTPQQVFNHPANRFVAGFIGSPQMNFFPAALEKIQTGYQLRAFGTAFPLAAEFSAALTTKNIPPMAITAGVRPEHSVLALQPDGPSAAGIAEVCEMMGSELYLHVTAEGTELVLRVPTAGLPESCQGGVPSGTQVRFTFLPQFMHLFDSKTGQNLLA